VSNPRFDHIRSQEEYESALNEITPQSPDSERAILGSIIMDNALTHQCQRLGLDPYEMYLRSHHVILAAAYELSEQGHEINPILLGDVLKRQGLLEVAGGVAYLSELTYGLPHITNVAHYIEIVKDKYALRELIKRSRINIAEAQEQASKAVTIVADAEARTSELAAEVLRGNTRGQEHRLVPIVEDRRAFDETIDKHHRGEAGGLPTGYRPIDDLLEGGGLQPQGLYVFAAQAKSGKTTLVLNIARRVAERFRATRSPKSVGIITLEMRRMALIMRLFASYSGVSFHRLTRPGLHGPDYEMAKVRQDEFFTLPIAISDALRAAPEVAREVVKNAFGPMNLGLLIVDYLQLMSHKRNATDDLGHRTQEVSKVSRSLKELGQDANIPVIVVSSLNREVMVAAKGDKQKSYEPEFWHLRESGQIEYDAETIFLLFNPDLRPGMTLEERQTLSRAKEWNVICKLAAQRNGPTDYIPLKFVRQDMTFLTQAEDEARNRATIVQGNGQLKSPSTSAKAQVGRDIRELDF